MKLLRALAAALMLASLPLGSETRPECTVDGITKKCDILKKDQDSQWIYLPDGTYFRNPEYDNSYWSWLFTSSYTTPRLSEARKKRILELVDFTRRSMIRQIEKGRKFEELSAAEKSQVERVRTVRFDLERSINDRSTACVASTPNAYYDPDNHRISICPTALMMPDAALAQTLGHEFAHSIDPCQSSLTLSKGPDGNLRTDSTALIGSTPGIPIAPSEVVAGAIPPSDYPQKTEMQCFANRGFQQTMSKEQVAALALKILLIKAFGITEAPKAIWETRITQNEITAQISRIETYPMCFRPEGLSNSIQETMCDMWSARVAADYQANSPTPDPYYPLSMLSLFLPKLCGPGAGTETRGGDEHYPGHERMNAIVMANPDLQKQLGCKAGAPGCDKGVGTATPAPASEVETAH